MHEEQILQLVKEDNPANPLSYVHNIVKPLAVNVLNDYILQCNDCNICNCVKTIGYGNPNASILIIGESSLEENQENKDNNPINNSCGETLKLILKKLAINKDSIFFINSVNCFPTRERGPTPIPDGDVTIYSYITEMPKHFYICYEETIKLGFVTASCVNLVM